MFLEEHLNQLGFSGSESKVYLELLKIGPQAASTLAKRLSLNRTTTYSILRSLSEKGIVASFERDNGSKCYLANDPNCLVGYLDRKCRTYDYYRSTLLSIIPKFRSLKEEYNCSKPVVSYFEGLEGVKHVTYDALNAADGIYCYLSLQLWLQLGLKDFILEYKNFRIRNKRLKFKGIAPDIPEVRNFFEENYDIDDPMTEMLFVTDPDCIELFRNEMTIYDDKVSIIHLDKGNEYGVVIQSERIADMQKKIFEKAWEAFKIGL